MKPNIRFALLGAGLALGFVVLLSAAVSTLSPGSFQVSAGPGYFVVIDTRTGEVKAKELIMSQVFSQTAVTGSLSVGTDIKGSIDVSTQGSLSVGQSVESDFKSPNWGQRVPWTIQTSSANPFR